MTAIETGKTYRLRFNFEVRDENTGTMKQYLRKGAELKVKQVSVEQESVWVEGVSLPLPLEALERAVLPVC
jgi:hypothetical protein